MSVSDGGGCDEQSYFTSDGSGGGTNVRVSSWVVEDRVGGIGTARDGGGIGKLRRANEVKSDDDTEDGTGMGGGAHNKAGSMSSSSSESW